MQKSIHCESCGRNLEELKKIDQFLKENKINCDYDKNELMFFKGIKNKITVQCTDCSIRNKKSNANLGIKPKKGMSKELNIYYVNVNDENKTFEEEKLLEECNQEVVESKNRKEEREFAIKIASYSSKKIVELFRDKKMLIENIKNLQHFESLVNETYQSLQQFLKVQEKMHNTQDRFLVSEYMRDLLKE